MIYNPPKRSEWGDVLSVAGTTTSSIGGVVASSGVGVVPGAVMAGAGAIMSGIGGLINAKENKEQQDYQRIYEGSQRNESVLQSMISNNRESQRYRDNLSNLTGFKSF